MKRTTYDTLPRFQRPQTCRQQHRRESSLTCRVCQHLIMAGQLTEPDVFNPGHLVHTSCRGGGNVPSVEQEKAFNDAVDRACNSEE